MLVGRNIIGTAQSGGGGGDILDIDVTRASAGGWVAVAFDVNRSNGGLGARQYLTLITYSDAQFSTEQDITEDRVFTLTNLADNGGYQYRMRRISGDAPTSSTLGLQSLPIGTWTSLQGGTVQPTDADSAAWTLFAPGTLTAVIQVQVINPDGGDIVEDRTVGLSITRP